MQTRTDFEQAAQKIAEKYVASNGSDSINKIATEAAKTAGLNPEGIRTMVRMANVAAFTKIFSEKIGSDRMIEFEVGDPEVVINNLHSSAEDTVKQASVSAYNRTADYYGDLPKTEEKIAYDSPRVELTNEPKVSKRYLTYIMKEAANKLRQEKAQLEYRWLDNMEKAAHILQLVCEGKDSEAIACEKDTLSKLGQDAIPELRILHYMVTKERDGFLYDNEKVASVIEHDISMPNGRFKNVIEFVKLAKETRDTLSKFASKQEWITNQLKKVED